MVISSLDSQPWHIEGTSASLSLGPLKATLDLARPAEGLHRIFLGDEPIEGARLLGLELAAGSKSSPQPLVDSFCRQSDLVASYDEQFGRPYAPQVYWRCLVAEAAGGATAVCIELLASVATSRLDAHPQLATGSRLSASQTLELLDAERGRFGTLPDSTNPWTQSGTEAGTGCVLARLPGERFSYVEMVHPLDRPHASLTVARGPEGFQIRRQLIHRRMEKGVIVRARVQGAIVPRNNDTTTAAGLYRQFAASALPLTA